MAFCQKRRCSSWNSHLVSLPPARDPMSGNCNMDYMACVSRPASGTKPCMRHSSNGDSIVPNVNGVYTHGVRRQGQQSWRSMWMTCSQPPPMTLRPHSSAQSSNPPGKSLRWVKRNSLSASQYGETERRELLCSARWHSSTKSSQYFTRLTPHQLPPLWHMVRSSYHLTRKFCWTEGNKTESTCCHTGHWSDR